jgi:hypothetical protein
MNQLKSMYDFTTTLIMAITIIVGVIIYNILSWAYVAYLSFNWLIKPMESFSYLSINYLGFVSVTTLIFALRGGVALILNDNKDDTNKQVYSIVSPWIFIITALLLKWFFYGF